jgi:hypothetical protein
VNVAFVHVASGVEPVVTHGENEVLDRLTKTGVWIGNRRFFLSLIPAAASAIWYVLYNCMSGTEIQSQKAFLAFCRSGLERFHIHAQSERFQESKNSRFSGDFQTEPEFSRLSGGHTHAELEFSTLSDGPIGCRLIARERRTVVSKEQNPAMSASRSTHGL